VAPTDPRLSRRGLMLPRIASVFGLCPSGRVAGPERSSLYSLGGTRLWPLLTRDEGGVCDRVIQPHYIWRSRHPVGSLDAPFCRSWTLSSRFVLDEMFAIVFERQGFLHAVAPPDDEKPLARLGDRSSRRGFLPLLLQALRHGFPHVPEVSLPPLPMTHGGRVPLVFRASFFFTHGERR